MRRRFRARSSSAQLASLTAAIADAVGVRPVSYRSGRFGFSADHVAGTGAARVPGGVERGAPVLRVAKGGPEFVEAPLTPYFLSYDSATRPGSSDVLEVPVSCGLNRRLPRMVQYAYARVPRPYFTKRALARTAHRRLRWLRPSYSSLADMMALARTLARANEPVLNLLFHSSEAIVGGSPYNRTEAELDAFFDRLERFFVFSPRGAGRHARHVRRIPPRVRRLMRILHVTPHLPPDQAANALLPWQLGNWARAAGDTVEYAAHPSRAGGPRRTGRKRHLAASPKRWIFRSHASPRIDCRRVAHSTCARVR